MSRPVTYYRPLHRSLCEVLGRGPCNRFYLGLALCFGTIWPIVVCVCYTSLAVRQDGERTEAICPYLCLLSPESCSPFLLLLRD